MDVPKYKVPPIGQPLLTTISSGCKTPVLDVKFCNLVKPYYYSNSPTIPRYSITCIVDPDKNAKFLRGIQTIEKNEGVQTLIKNDTRKEDGEHITTGNLLVKFQCKNQIPVYLVHDSKEPVLMTMEDEIAVNEKVMIVYDILRYTKKNTMEVEHGLSFKPTAIYYYPDKEQEEWKQ